MRPASGTWHEHTFAETQSALEPLWQADLRPFDQGAGGFSEFVRIDTGSLELIVYHHAGWALR